MRGESQPKLAFLVTGARGGLEKCRQGGGEGTGSAQWSGKLLWTRGYEIIRHPVRVEGDSCSSYVYIKWGWGEGGRGQDLEMKEEKQGREP